MKRKRKRNLTSANTPGGIKMAVKHMAASMAPGPLTFREMFMRSGELTIKLLAPALHFLS